MSCLHGPACLHRPGKLVPAKPMTSFELAGRFLLVLGVAAALLLGWWSWKDGRTGPSDARIAARLAGLLFWAAAAAIVYGWIAA